MTLRPIVVALVALGVLASCSRGEEEAVDDPINALEETLDQAEDWPACQKVWVVGQKLPKEYEGCTADDGTIVSIAIAYDCADGTTLTFVDEPAAFARIGGEIKTGDKQSDAFGVEFEKCEPA